VVSREFAGGDTAFVSNDPHYRLSAPMLFQEAALDSTPAGGSLKVRGYSLVGVPGVLIGHNQKIAWGMTNLSADVDDIYVEVLDGKSQKTAWEGLDSSLNDVYTALDEEDLTIQVRNGRGSLDPVPFKLRSIRKHGPVFSDHIPEVHKALEHIGKSQNLSLVATYRWVGHEKSSEFAAILGVNRASNFSEFKAALSDFRAGAQNLVFADVAGDIGYYGNGNFPNRPYASVAQAPFVPVVPYLRGVTSKVFFPLPETSGVGRFPQRGAFASQPRFRAYCDSKQ
jgi:penicillin amidase